MASFIFYDLTFLVLFTLFVFIFLYRNKKSLKREMKIGFAYKTQWGVKLINYVGDNFKKTLDFLKYIIIGTGYILMVAIIYVIGRSAYIYVRHPVLVTQIVKAPPVAPVIPYFPKLFGLESFFPPFYFTYFVLALGIVAVVHEFSHGIFMRRYKIGIKSTGLFFLGPFFGAFVEQEEKSFVKAKKTDQMAVLGAGVFANIITGLIFVILWALLFHVTYTPIGASFDDYSMGIVNISSITSIGGIPIESNMNNLELIDFVNNNNLSVDLVLEGDNESLSFTKIINEDKSYLITEDILEEQLAYNLSLLLLYEDFPAINAGLRGTIIGIDGNEVKSYNQLINIMKNYQPGDEVTIKTEYNGDVREDKITLAGVPDEQGNGERAIIGVANEDFRRNFGEWLSISIFRFKERFTDYKVNSQFLEFIYYLFFWMVVLNFAVALFNMLPFTIFDGGRFFYLTVWGLTKNEKIGKAAFKWAGIIIGAMFLLMLIAWFYGIIN